MVAVLTDLLQKQQAYAEHDGERFLDAVQNALLVANAEQYYRIMYYGSRASWNLRDRHMFETLQNLLRITAREPRRSSGRTTPTSAMRPRPRCRRAASTTSASCAASISATDAYSIGFGTDSGTVAAASDWDGPMQVKDVRPAHRRSYERLFHDSGVPRFLLPLAQARIDRRAQGAARSRGSSGRSA